MTAPDFLVNGPADAPASFIFAHGAGAPMDTSFMNRIAEGIATAGFRVLRFEFPYMAGRRTGGSKRPPDRQSVLLDTWRNAIAATTGNGALVIGGKSMGGRMASLVADESGINGVICLGYPFHPPGKPDKLRTEHLKSIISPTLILQGERDPFGTRAEVESYQLSEAVTLEWVPDGNHDLSPRKAAGQTVETNMARTVTAAVTFLENVIPR
ncbi:alpha/beta family hydrolase [Nisaea sp.]|uniref:alpha/beta family hydrolase n=1 Tax=Nisaea sp. TaxID=2024842 RepID=UPI0032978B60